jgi:hypothetical protein
LNATKMPSSTSKACSWNSQKNQTERAQTIKLGSTKTNCLSLRASRNLSLKQSSSFLKSANLATTWLPDFRMSIWRWGKKLTQKGKFLYNSCNSRRRQKFKKYRPSTSGDLQTKNLVRTKSLLKTKLLLKTKKETSSWKWRTESVTGKNQ